MRNVGDFDRNFASLQLADNLLIEARDEMNSAEFALLVAGSASRWRFSAVWKTLRSHIIQFIDQIWLTKIQPRLDDIMLNDFLASIDSAMKVTGVTE